MAEATRYTRVIDTLVGHGKVFERGQLLSEPVYKILVEQEMRQTASDPPQEVAGPYRLTGDVMKCQLPIGHELELELEGGRRLKIRAVSESEFVAHEARYPLQDKE